MNQKEGLGFIFYIYFYSLIRRVIDESEGRIRVYILYLFLQSDKKRVIDESEGRIWADILLSFF
jgi:hypothetical protein